MIKKRLKSLQKQHSRISGIATEVKHYMGKLADLPPTNFIGYNSLTADARIIHIDEEDKVVVIISDGFPAGYPEVEEELAKSLRSAARRNIGLIGIGLGSRAVKKYMRVSCVVETPYELMKRFVDAFFEYTASL